ncbi:hypothetical protein [Ralstonia phage RP13]|nr:hypothetical protein [Ralstonia phage RP13]
MLSDNDLNAIAIIGVVIIAVTMIRAVMKTPGSNKPSYKNYITKYNRYRRDKRL